MAKKTNKKKTEKKKRGFFAALFSPIDEFDDDELLDGELDDELLDDMTDEELEAYYDGLSDEELEAYDELDDEEFEDYDELDDEELEEYDEFDDEELEEYDEPGEYDDPGDGGLEGTDVPDGEEPEAFDVLTDESPAEHDGPKDEAFLPDAEAANEEYADEALDESFSEPLFSEDGPDAATEADPLFDEETGPESVRSKPRSEGAETSSADSAPADPLEPEKIVLFRQPEEELPPTTTTRLFRTGSSTATRIHLNETETLRAIDAIRRKARDAELKKQEEQQKKRETVFERISAFVKRTAGGLLFTIAVIAALLTAGYYFFLLSDIRITGLDRTLSDAEIAQLTGLYRREHMLLIDLDEVRETISANPYMQVNDIEYVFPARIRIDLSERTQAAAIIGLDYNVIIDENGYVLSMSAGSVANLIQITGISMSGIKLGQRIGETSDFTTASLISIIGKLKEYGLIGKIRSLDMTTPLAIMMYTYNGFEIHVGQPTDLDNKFSTLSEALPRAEAARCFTGTLYLSSKGGAVYSPAGAEEAALESASTDANAIRLESGYEYGMYTAPDAEGNVQQGQSYSTSNGAQLQQQQSTPSVPDSPDDFQG